MAETVEIVVKLADGTSFVQSVPSGEVEETLRKIMLGEDWIEVAEGRLVRVVEISIADPAVYEQAVEQLNNFRGVTSNLRGGGMGWRPAR